MAGKDKTIKTTLELAGEKEYNEALRQAQRNLRTLRSELKAETAELGSNATAQQKNEARIKSLKKQIAEQEKTVATLKKALAEAKRDYADNEDVVQKWERKLNDARATLAGMQNDLQDLSSGMENVTNATEMGVVATKSFADTVAGIGAACSSVADSIEGIFTGMFAAVQEATVQLWEFIGETAAKANNYEDIAGYWGTDAATIQKYANAVKDVGGNFEDLQATVSRLVLGGRGDLIAEYLGISEVNYDNQWDYAMAAMERMYELREKGQLGEGFWEEVFGEKKSTKVMDLLNDWGKTMDRLDTYDADKGGFGMDSDALETMSLVYEKMSAIGVMWTSLKDQIAAGLGTISIPLMMDIQGGLGALNDYLKAETDEERSAALEALVGHIGKFFDDLKAALEDGIAKLREVAGALQESENPGVQALGEALEAIADGLDWIINHADAVKKALEAMFGAWLVAKLGAILATVTGIVAKIEIIKAFGALNGGAGIAEAAGAAGGAGGAAAGAAGSAAVDAAAVTAAGKVIGGISTAAVAFLFKSAMDYRNAFPERLGSAANIDYVADQDAELRDAMIEYVEAQKEQQEYLDRGEIDSEAAAEVMRRAAEAATNFWEREGAQQLYDLYNDWRQENGAGNMDWDLWNRENDRRAKEEPKPEPEPEPEPGYTEEVRRALLELIDAQAKQQEYLDQGDVFSEAAGEAMQRAAEASEQFWAQEGAQELYDLYNGWREENGMGNADWGLWTAADGGALADAFDTLNSTMSDLETAISGNGNTANPEATEQTIANGFNTFGGIMAALPATVGSAVSRALASVKVVLDGEAVGRMVTQPVSHGIAGIIKGMVK